MSKQFAAVIAAIILLFAGVIIISNHKSNTTKSAGSTATLTQHVEGSPSTGVKLVEYGDYECPYCQQFAPTVQAVAAEFKDQIQFQFRNFPLVNVHQNALAAARAAEAAAVQNKFWEMHDALYQPSNWQVWTTASDPTTYFTQYAQGLGLNVAQFKTDFASSHINDLIQADMAEGTKLNIQGTPTFFLDGKQLSLTNNTVAAFEKVIKAEIAKKQPKQTAPEASPIRISQPSSSDNPPTQAGTSGQ